MWKSVGSLVVLLGLGCGGASGGQGGDARSAQNAAGAGRGSGTPMMAGAGAPAAAMPGKDAGVMSPAVTPMGGRAAPGQGQVTMPARPEGDGAAGVTMCGGNALPPRAIATPGPYAIGPAAAGLEPYFPTDDWRSLEPAKLGFDPAKLDEALAYNPAKLKTEALLVIRHGYIASEQYFGSFTQSSRHQSYSMAKSFSSALVGIAIEQGKISGVDEKLCKYYPSDWKCDDPSDKHGSITIHHALTLTTGLQWQEDWRTKPSTTSNDAMSGNVLQTALRRPVVDEPGTKARYSSADPALLRAVFEKATGMGVLEYGRSVMLDAIGLSSLQWNGDTYWGIEATAREFAKFGYLYLNRGAWDGHQIVPAAWVDDSTRQLHDKDAAADPDVCQDWYYYLWHINLPNRLGSGVEDPNCPTQFCTSTKYANLPPEAYFAEGLAGQYIFVVPSADLVLVRLGNDGFAGIEIWDAYVRELLDRVLSAIVP